LSAARRARHYAPPHTAGFGWVKPTRCYQAPRAVRTHCPRGAPLRVWPAGPDGGPGPPPPIANPIERTRRAAALEAASSSRTQRADPQAAAMGREPFADGTLQEAAAGAPGEGPHGSALLAARVPWLVRFRTAVNGRCPAGAASPGQPQTVLREVIHRPSMATAAAASGGGSASSGGSGATTLVVSTYLAATGQLLARHKQRCAATRQPSKVGRPH
jgi:hypothetical protein